MKGRTWTAEEQPAIGLEGLNGAKPVAEMCREHLPVGRQVRARTDAHPFWGDRRVWAWLRDREGLLVKKTRGSRLRREAGLTITRGPQVATRTPKAKPQATRPRQDWGIDLSADRQA